MCDYELQFTCPKCGKETVFEHEENYQMATIGLSRGSTYPCSNQHIEGRFEQDYELYCKCPECNKVSAFHHYSEHKQKEVTCPYCGSTLPNERCINRRRNYKSKHDPPLPFFFYNDRKQIEERANKILQAKSLEEEPDRAYVQWSKNDKIKNDRENLLSPSEIFERTLKIGKEQMDIDIEIVPTIPKEPNMTEKLEVSPEEFKSSRFYGLQCRLCAHFRAVTCTCEITSEHICRSKSACQSFEYR